MGWADILGVAGALLAIPSFGFYIRNTLRGQTRPHPFSWMVWSLLAGLSLMVQLQGGAGPGAYVTGVSALGCLLILLLGLRHRRQPIVPVDWLCLVLALSGALLWFVASQPVAAVALLSLATVASFAPTYRKGWQQPHAETALTYGLDMLKYLLSLLALAQYTLATAFYPALCLLLNLGLVALLLWRRRAVPALNAD